jgi:hypothetical protein
MCVPLSPPLTHLLSSYSCHIHFNRWAEAREPLHVCWGSKPRVSVPLKAALNERCRYQLRAVPPISCHSSLEYPTNRRERYGKHLGWGGVQCSASPMLYGMAEHVVPINARVTQLTPPTAAVLLGVCFHADAVGVDSESAAVPGFKQRKARFGKSRRQPKRQCYV